MAMARAIVRSTAKMSDRSNPQRMSAFDQAKMELAARLADVVPRNVEQPFVRRTRVASSVAVLLLAARWERRVGPIDRTGSGLVRGSGMVARKPMAQAVRLDGRILPGELSQKRIDLRLALGRDCREVRAISLEEGARVRSLTAPVAGAFWLELRDHRCHPPRDLPVDQVELALDLSPRFLHARELNEAIGSERHDATLRCQPMKSDGPP